MNTTISGDINNRKEIYKIRKKGGRLKNTPKTITKSISPLKKQKRKEITIKTSKKTIIRIANTKRKRFKINSNSDDKKLIKLSNDNKAEIDDKDKDKIEKIAEVKKNQISTTNRSLRNTTLPVKYRDS